MERELLLEMLVAQEGNPLSGERLSEILGVSRSAIWKQISQLRQFGYQISGSPHSGYLLDGTPDLLYPAELRRGLQTRDFACQVYHYQQTGSTNQLALELARKGYPAGTVVVAEEQTAGRGRWQRPWFSPVATGIWLSLILRPSIIAYHAPQVTLVVGAAVARAIDQVAGLRPGIKWPNDLVAGGKKLGGILVEMESAADQVNFLVVGIGINVNQAESDFPPELEDIATSLRVLTGHPVDRVSLARRLLECLEEDYDTFCREGFAVVSRGWLEYQETLGRRVEVLIGDHAYIGVAEELNPDGSLALRLDSGERRSVNAGEITFCHRNNQSSN